MRCRRGKAGGASRALAGLALLASICGRSGARAGEAPGAGGQDTAGDSYFLLRAEYTFGGRPVVIRYVAKCAPGHHRWDPGEMASGGVAPAVYGQALGDGGALVIRTPRLCDGQATADGTVPERYLPLAMRFRSRDRLDTGVAYVIAPTDNYPRPDPPGRPPAVYPLDDGLTYDLARDGKALVARYHAGTRSFDRFALGTGGVGKGMLGCRSPVDTGHGGPFPAPDLVRDVEAGRVRSGMDVDGDPLRMPVDARGGPPRFVLRSLDGYLTRYVLGMYKGPS